MSSSASTSDMEIENLYPGSWASNCYLLTVGTHCAVVDPSTDSSAILNRIEEKGGTLDLILLTHGHFDHITGLDGLCDLTSIPAMIHEEDLEMPNDAEKNASLKAFGQAIVSKTPQKSFRDGDIVFLGNEKITVLHTPGHTKGSCCFLCNNEFLITGDTLFANTFGRYDHFGGSVFTLCRSLHFLETLPHDLTIYPGHGEPAKLGTALQTIFHH